MANPAIRKIFKQNMPSNPTKRNLILSAQPGAGNTNTDTIKKYMAGTPKHNSNTSMPDVGLKKIRFPSFNTTENPSNCKNKPLTC